MHALTPSQAAAATEQPDRFRQIADLAPVPMWLVDREGKREFVNQAFVDFSGLDYEHARSVDWHSLTHPDDVDRLAAEAAIGQASGQAFTLEGRYRRCDGAWRWLHIALRPNIDAEGRNQGLFGVTLDITDAKEAEIALRERESQLSAFISQTTAGFAQVDVTGRFTLVNDRYCEIVGYSAEQLYGMTMQEITHPDDLPRNIPLFEAAARDGTPYTHEKRYIRGDGEIVWVHNSVAVIRREGGEPYGILAITLDVTERRRADEHQQLLIHELNHRVKNSLAIVQAISQQTFGRVGKGADPIAALEAFQGRLGALSAAHNLLTRDAWTPAPLAELISQAVAPHAAAERFRLSGPDLTIQPKTAITLALAVHELATNAVKHGALGVAEGSVDIAWRLEPAGDRAVGRLHLVWTETGGPEVVEPKSRGFGTRMIERGLAAELGGKVKMDFRPDGVVCTVDAPLPGAA